MQRLVVGVLEGLLEHHARHTGDGVGAQGRRAQRQRAPIGGDQATTRPIRLVRLHGTTSHGRDHGGRHFRFSSPARTSAPAPGQRDYPSVSDKEKSTFSSRWPNPL
jgi:hypothetical protein